MVADNGGKPVRGADPIALMKAVKNHAEIAGARAAHMRDGVAMARFLAWLEREAPTGKLTEIDAVEALESFRRDTGAAEGRVVPDHLRRRGRTARSCITASPARPTAPSDRTNCSWSIPARNTRTAPPTSPAPSRSARRPTEMRDRFTRVLKGHIAIATRGVPGGHQRRAARSAGAHRAVAGRARFRSRHRPRRRQLSVGARGPGAHLQARHRRAQAAA